MFSLDYNDQGAILRLVKEQRGLFARLLSKAPARNLDRLEPRDRDLILAIADVRALENERPGEAQVQSDQIKLSHTIVASLPSSSAETLGLPPLVDLTLHTDAEGLPGQRNFRLRYEWRKNGQRQFPTKVGALLETSDGVRRLPLWLMEALDAAA
ncbi:MAG: hypothetical protein JO012_23080 [Hyphomicrobiales bacterium]|nr:hypothetical protein [Hyphomicrobiales bacterium]